MTLLLFLRIIKFNRGHVALFIVLLKNSQFFIALNSVMRHRSLSQTANAQV